MDYDQSKVDKEKELMRPTRDDVFMEMSRSLEKRSICKRNKVGAMILKDGRPITVGYNGPASGEEHCIGCEGEACTKSVHAEANAIAFAAKTGVATEGCTIYTTLAPCINCAKLIVQSGIVRVVYERDYRLREGLEYLERFITVDKYRVCDETKPDSGGKEDSI
jgi:dCMP deaminase